MDYAWGSTTAIAELLGHPSPSADPQAELWMGAHPKAPSTIAYKGQKVALDALIKQNPDAILGRQTAAMFDGKLPYLFKVLAAKSPLSIQAHPSKETAIKGFEKENRAGKKIDAFDRSYKDDNHKPECICALTPFWALNGFRKPEKIIPLLNRICPDEILPEFEKFKDAQNSSGLRVFFEYLMRMTKERKQIAASQAFLNALPHRKIDPAYRWIIDLNAEYCGDIGILSPVLLNLIKLKPGEAMFLDAGELHAYLDGTGIEVMANSDNVLRGGLTSKHVDLDELFHVVNFSAIDPEILPAGSTRNGEHVYQSRAKEFVLSVIDVDREKHFKATENKVVQILLCTQGNGTITGGDGQRQVSVKKGDSFLIPAPVDSYTISGKLRIYKVMVP